MGLPNVTLEGNLGADPELRFVASGAAVASFRVGCTERRKDPQTQQWVDGRQCWVAVSCWRELAENVAETLHRGDKVVVTGRLYEETYTPNGSDQPRTVMKLDADTVSVSLRSATAQVRRAERQQGGGQPQWQPGQGQPADDPWARPAQAQQPQQGQPQQAPPQGQQPPPAQPGWGQTPPAQPPGQGWGQQPPAYDQPPF